ncbi:MAG: mannose-1-phosphate guanylyltransferase [Phycisphaerales bacterium]|nr:mannose-1-phosphate guanylyltransferase [Phycisphaerales bacterium]
MSRYAMIMAGGAGTRLWPMSRPEQPKQLIPFIEGRSLLQIAADRLEGVVPMERRLICTGRNHLDVIRRRLPEFTDDRLLGEPVGRDTLNAIGLTATVLAARDPEAIFAVLTADHLITPQDEFTRCMTLGFDLVARDPSRMVTFGITPTHPATGYGYVQLGDAVEGFDGAHRTARFVEKPDEATARTYLESGDFAWNSGMFIFSAASFLKAVEEFAPEAAPGLATIGAAWDGPERETVLADVYPELPRISVDYGIMEPASTSGHFNVCTVPMGVQWIDVGSWPSYGETLDADADGNRTGGPAEFMDSRNVLAVSEDPDHLIATIGCEDLVIVHTPDATLVFPRGRDQDVKAMADRAAGRGG